MHVFSDPLQFARQDRPVSLALGVFDGVHVGHQELIGRLIRTARAGNARAIVATFDPHPAAVVAPDRLPPAIQNLEQRLRAMEALSPDGVWVIAFDETFSRQSGEEFVRALLRHFGRLHSLHVGSRFTFGHRRSGNVALLQQLGRQLGFDVDPVDPVRRDGDVVSSTRIRRLIQTGELAAAARLLGRSWSLMGKVVRGEQLGRKLGFPTANLNVPGRVLPPGGVYAAWATFEERRVPAAVNIGRRPTVVGKTAPVRVEAHLLDVELDLYDRKLELEFVRQLRPEQRFDSLEDLSQQIARDVESTRQALNLPTAP